MIPDGTRPGSTRLDQTDRGAQHSLGRNSHHPMSKGGQGLYHRFRHVLFHHDPAGKDQIGRGGNRCALGEDTRRRRRFGQRPATGQIPGQNLRPGLKLAIPARSTPGNHPPVAGQVQHRAGRDPGALARGNTGRMAALNLAWRTAGRDDKAKPRNRWRIRRLIAGRCGKHVARSLHDGHDRGVCLIIRDGTSGIGPSAKPPTAGRGGCGPERLGGSNLPKAASSRISAALAAATFGESKAPIGTSVKSGSPSYASRSVRARLRDSIIRCGSSVSRALACLTDRLRGSSGSGSAPDPATRVRR